MSILDKRDQSVGAGSFALQAQGDIHYGNSTSEVFAICNLFLRNEMSNLRDDALTIAKERVDEYANQIVKKFTRELDGLLIEKLRDPDIQYALNHSVIQVARKGVGVKSELLKELIVSKIKNDDEEADLIIDQALDIASKLTTNEIKFISFTYYLRYCHKIVNGQSIDVLTIDSDIKVIPPNITRADVFKVYTGIYSDYNKDLHQFLGALDSLKHVDRAMLEIKGCIYTGRTYKESFYKLLERKSGIPLENNESFFKERLPLLSDILTSFGVENLERYDYVTLSPIGIIIAENYLKAKNFVD